MIRRFGLYLFLCSLVAFPLSSEACGLAGGDQFVSTQSGDWDVAATWGNTGNDVPGFNDHVLISSNTIVFHSNQETVGRVEIESTAELQSNGELRINQGYYNDGLHSGTNRVRFRGNNDSIIGTGIIQTETANRVDADRQVYPGSSMTFRNSNMRLPNNGELINNGTLILDNCSFTGNGSGTIVNGSNALLQSTSAALMVQGDLQASATGNTVEYNSSSGDQEIYKSVDGYYNLLISGSAGSTKDLTSRIRVLNDLSINTSTLSAVDTTTIAIGGDFNASSGTFDAVNGRVDFTGTTAQTISGDLQLHDILIDHSGPGVSISSDTLSLEGFLTINQGTLNTNGRLKLISNGTVDGAIGTITSGGVSGDVVVQRYIEMGATNWRFLGSPTTDATFQDWKDDFIMSGFPGSHFPTYFFESIIGYDETVTGFKDSGAVSITISDPITPGVGFWVYSGDSLGGTAPFTIDVTGPVTQGNFNFSLDYTPGSGLTNDGWNLVANPYPAAIDWDGPGWSSSGIDDAIYLWNADLNAYGTYIGGAIVNEASNIIPQGHGFYVKAFQASPTLSVSETSKYDTTVAFLRPRPLDDLVVRFKQSQGGFSYESLVRINKDASENFDSSLDGYYFQVEGPNPIHLYSRMNSIDYSINGISVDGIDTVDLFSSANPGSTRFDYHVDRNQGNYCLYLLDRATNDLTYLPDSGGFNFNIETVAHQNYYSLIIAKRDSNIRFCSSLVGTEPVEAAVNPGAFLANGMIHYRTDEHVGKKFELFSLHGQLVKTGTIGNEAIDVRTLPAGVFVLRSGNASQKLIKPDSN